MMNDALLIKLTANDGIVHCFTPMQFERFVNAGSVVQQPSVAVRATDAIKERWLWIVLATATAAIAFG